MVDVDKGREVEIADNEYYNGISCSKNIIIEVENKLSNLRVAIVCDWLTSKGGAAKVEEAIGQIFPQADVYTSVCNLDNFDWLRDRKIYTTWLNKLPYLRNKHQLFAWLRPTLFEGFDLSKYDLVISSSSAEAKCVITKPDTIHICYCHTPIRYYWSDYHEYLHERMEFGWLNPLVRLLMPRMVHGLRMTDRLAAERVDYFVANSRYIAKRIKKYYRREAVVIYPPVDFDDNNPLASDSSENSVNDYYLFMGRLVPYKKAELVAEAFIKNGKKLKIAGPGPQIKKIGQIIADYKNIELLGYVSEEDKVKLLQNCRALVFPGEEDFGIVPVEAMSYGKPVIAYGVGGVTESVIDEETGLFFAEQTIESLNSAIDKSEKKSWESGRIVKRAELFRKERFQKELVDFITNIINNKNESN